MGTIKKGSIAFILFYLLAVGWISIYLASQILTLPDKTEVSATLSELYEADQKARFAGFENPTDIIALSVGDWIRVRKVRRIVAANMLSTGQDYANAARILQHGNDAKDYQAAMELSLKAYELGEEDMLRHRALAEDRYLIAIGEEQKYGSQFECDAKNGWHLQPVDPSVTDEERALVNIDRLQVMQRKMTELNRATNGKCTPSQETIWLIETIMEGRS